MLLDLRLWPPLFAAGIRTNDGFAGIYDYRRTAEYPRFLDRFIACMESPDGLLMVHPGKVEPWRRMEYGTLRTLSPERLTPSRHGS